MTETQQESLDSRPLADQAISTMFGMIDPTQVIQKTKHRKPKRTRVNDETSSNIQNGDILAKRWNDYRRICTQKKGLKVPMHEAWKQFALLYKLNPADAALFNEPKLDNEGEEQDTGNVSAALCQIDDVKGQKFLRRAMRRRGWTNEHAMNDK